MKPPPPSGPGLSGSDPVPTFGSENCHSRSRIITREIKRDADGKFYFIDPTTKEKVFVQEPKDSGHHVKFTPISSLP